jgi:hypothetical protein
VTRHPYSFIGDAKPGKTCKRHEPGHGSCSVHAPAAGQSTGLSKEGTWHSGLVEYTDGTERGARQAEEMMQRLGAKAGTRARVLTKHARTHARARGQEFGSTIRCARTGSLSSRSARCSGLAASASRR